MPLHPQVRAFVDEAVAEGGPPLEEMSVLQARSLDAGFIELQAPAQEVADVRDVLVAGAAGLLPARVYHPSPGEALPMLCFFHGGGYVVGNIDVPDRPCRAIANAARCVVVSVGYRTGPETKFPGPVEDGYAAARWVSEHATELGGVSGYLAIGGESAGGGLAAAVALMARDRGEPSIDYQVLIYPMLAPARGTTFASYRENGEGYLLTRAAMEWFWGHYLARDSDGHHPYAAPVLAEDHARLPRALVITAEYDPLRDEGIAYAEKLRAAAVDVEHLPYHGAIHGFLVMSGRMDHGLQVVDDVAVRLRADFERHTSASGSSR